MENEKTIKELEQDIERWMEEWKNSNQTWYKNFLTTSINKARNKIKKIQDNKIIQEKKNNEPGLF